MVINFPFTATIRRKNSTLYVTIPSDFVNSYKLKEGIKANLLFNVPEQVGGVQE